MKTIKQTLIALSFTAGFILFSLVPAQSATIFNTYSSYTTAFPGIVVENFEDTVLQTGLSVNSTYGGNIALGAYNDRVGGGNTTTWTHSTGFTSWGAWFDLTPNGIGSSILITVVDTGEIIGELNSSNPVQFWGFTTGYDFSQVRLSGGSGPGVETYFNVDLAYTIAPVPEPSTILLLGIGLLGVAGIGRKRILK